MNAFIGLAVESEAIEIQTILLVLLICARDPILLEDDTTVVLFHLARNGNKQQTVGFKCVCVKRYWYCSRCSSLWAFVCVGLFKLIAANERF
jgi:hypothetical protein